MSSPKSRIFYIDNLRIFLISLVVLHHLAITYGGPGSWFYNESSAEFPEILVYSMFLATNQSFFMGMFFFVSAYFLLPSLQKKGIRKYAIDRLKRLGIPLLLFFFLLFPLTIYFRNHLIFRETGSWLDYAMRQQTWGFGPMWFVEALLIFSFGVILWKKWFASKTTFKPKIPLPSPGQVVIAALIIGILQFIIRIWLPVGWAMPFTDFQFPHFVQYIVLFILGLVAFRNNWLEHITFKSSRNWFIAVQVLILVVFPIIFAVGGSSDVDRFMGGPHWQSAAYALWEQLVGFGMIMALLGIFKQVFNTQNGLGRKLSASAYGVYVFHAPILVLISAICLDLNIPQFMKFVVLAPFALGVSFVIAYLNKQLPLIRDIF